MAPRSTAARSDSPPPNFPIGVRAALTMKIPFGPIVRVLDRKIPREACSSCKHDCVELCLELFQGDVDTDVDVRAEHHTCLIHQRQPPVQELLLHLELGDAVAQQAPNPIGLLEDGHHMSSAVQLFSSGETRRT